MNRPMFGLQSEDKSDTMFLCTLHIHIYKDDITAKVLNVALHFEDEFPFLYFEDDI